MTTPKKKNSASHNFQLCVAALLAAVGVLPLLAPAAEIRGVEMVKVEGVYQVRAETWLDAAPDFVFAVLLDYNQFHRLTRGITTTKWLDESRDAWPLAYTRIDSCVAFFCRRLEKVEMVKVDGLLSYSTEALPARSDFVVYTARWALQSDGKGTRIVYDMRMQPDFWVPPLVGPWAIRRKAESSALKIAERIEYLAANNIPLANFDLAKYLANN